jgi:hypothetical protein
VAFFFYALIAFAAGFSERFAHVIFGAADLTVAKGLTAETAEPENASGRARATAAPATSAQDGAVPPRPAAASEVPPAQSATSTRAPRRD